MQILMFLLSVILFGYLGLVTWTRADLPIIQREIALNTRKDPNEGPSYNIIKLLSTLIKIGAVLIWLVGLVGAIMALTTGGAVPMYY